MSPPSEEVLAVVEAARSKGPVLLDLFCCAGGAGKGYADAGFQVIGVDIEPQPNYPFTFFQADAIEFARKFGHLFDVKHASPPCQKFSRTKTLHSNEHPDLIEPTREVFLDLGGVWVIENVVGAPLIDPIKLSGQHFNMTARDVDGVLLKLVRHRLFESSAPISAPAEFHPNKGIQTASVYGAGGGWTPRHRDNPDRRGGYIPHTDVVKELLGIDWMTKHEMSQSIPPVFTEHIGRQLLAHLDERKVA
ncbi:hypothetical protein [Brevibacterium sanguinis]|uniref:hypothetical protein n=1 Tax=Brevibacterium sanguinis TaxID=232444 RepID=UPI0031D03BBE